MLKQQIRDKDCHPETEKHCIRKTNHASTLLIKCLKDKAVEYEVTNQLLTPKAKISATKRYALASIHR